MPISIVESPEGSPEFNPSDHPHRRFNPLTKSYVLISPHRTKRPWLGQLDPPSLVRLPSYDPKCYLCPGNERMGGETNPSYESVYSFTNDFPALLPAPVPRKPEASSSFLEIEPVSGKCEVLCFSPRHDATLAVMTVDEVASVVRGWRGIWENSEEEYVQIFENRGSAMGASNPHPHGQIWSLSYVPQEPATVLANFDEYAEKSADGKGCLLLDYAKVEKEKGVRIVVQNEDWLAVVPFWAVWPFECMIMPARRQIHSLGDLTPSEEISLASVTKSLLVKYDNLFSCPFPYSMGLHQTPSPKYAARATASGNPNNAQLHLLFYPPLLRSASVRKFAVGFEMLAEAQRDLTPEQAAQRLREAEDVHYLEKLDASQGEKEKA